MTPAQQHPVPRGKWPQGFWPLRDENGKTFAQRKAEKERQS